jgi:hypothetical protein
MDEKILTLHPQGKQGVNISKQKYDTMKNAIIETLAEFNELTFSELTSKIHQKLAGKFDGSINWYVVTVKLDLEARGILERIPQTTPHQIRLAK